MCDHDRFFSIGLANRSIVRFNVTCILEVAICNLEVHNPGEI